MTELQEEEELQLAMAISLTYQDNKSENPAENISTTIVSALPEEVTVSEDVAAKRKQISYLVKAIEKKTEDLTCPVCLETAAAPIYSICQQMHFVCSDCQPKLSSCPECREAYQGPPRSHRYAERDALELKDLQEALANLTENLKSTSLARSPRSESPGSASSAVGQQPPNVKPQEKLTPGRSPRSEVPCNASSAVGQQPPNVKPQKKMACMRSPKHEVPGNASSAVRQQPPTVKLHEKMAPMRSPRSEVPGIAPSAVGQQPPNVKPQEKMAPVRSPRNESSAARHHPPSDPPFLLVTSSGPTADHQSSMLGLYRKTEQMTDGQSLYIQLHDCTYS